MTIEITAAALASSLKPLLAPLLKSIFSTISGKLHHWNTDASAERLSKLITDINTVKTMWSKDEGILIDNFYYPTKITKKNNLAVKTIGNLLNEKAVVEGLVGQGKSILFRHLCVHAVKNNLTPIFLELRMISKTQSLESLILDYLDVVGIEGGKSTFNYLAKNNKVILILDGFDEIQSNIMTKSVNDIESIRRKYSTLKILISSRPFHEAQNLAGFNVYKLSDLMEEDYDKFLLKLIPDICKRNSIIQAISDAPSNIRGVITTPLMLTLLVLVYESEKEIPSNIPDFYEKLFSTVFTKHDRLKSGFDRKHYSGLSESKIQKLFDAFCFMAIQSGNGRSLKDDAFRNAFDKACKYVPESQCELENFKKDIIKVACLMLEDGFDMTTFLHKSVAEYHAASFIKYSSDPISIKFYEQAPESYREWESVMHFLSFIDSYRYGRDYILKYYPGELKEITSLLENKSKEELKLYIESKIPHIVFEIKDYNLHTYSRRVSRQHKIHKNISSRIHETAEIEIFRATKETIDRAVKESTITRGRYKSISLESFIDNFNITEIWQVIGEAEQDIINTLEKYRAIVKTEDSKHQIFS